MRDDQQRPCRLKAVQGGGDDGWGTLVLALTWHGKNGFPRGRHRLKMSEGDSDFVKGVGTNLGSPAYQKNRKREDQSTTHDTGSSQAKMVLLLRLLHRKVIAPTGAGIVDEGPWILCLP